jgi:hypothetical protein
MNLTLSGLICITSFLGMNDVFFAKEKCEGLGVLLEA